MPETIFSVITVNWHIYATVRYPDFTKMHIIVGLFVDHENYILFEILIRLISEISLGTIQILTRHHPRAKIAQFRQQARIFKYNFATCLHNLLFAEYK